MNAAELLVKCLESEGVKLIFGVPGEENEDMLFAIEKSSITFIPTRHEQGAAFIADVIGRLTQKPGVCLATLGPGATNLMTGIADAYLDRSPVIAITGQGDLSRLHHESHQVIDICKMMDPVTKRSYQITNASQVSEIVRQAFQTATTKKFGPVHIELPEDVAKENCNDLTPLPSPLSIATHVKLFKAHEITNIFKSSKNPLLLVGNGVIRSKAEKQLIRFADKFNIPIVTTFMAKGIVNESSKLFLGAVGLGFKDYVIDAFVKSDLIISVGYDIVEYSPDNWNLGKTKKILHIDETNIIPYDNYNATLEITGDIKTILEELEILKIIPFKINWIKKIQNRILSSINAFELKNNNDERFTVPGLLHILNKKLSKDSVLISDVGSHKMWIARNYLAPQPNSCIISNGFATMGIAIPGAIGAQLTYPDKQVIAIMGDGGAMMNIQELETMQRLHLPCIIIILKDNKYGLIEWKQEMSSNKSYGVNFTGIDFVKIAKSFGIKGYRPYSVKHLKRVISKVLKSRKPAVIEVEIDNYVNKQLTKELSNHFKNK